MDAHNHNRWSPDHHHESLEVQGMINNSKIICGTNIQRIDEIWTLWITSLVIIILNNLFSFNLNLVIENKS